MKKLIASVAVASTVLAYAPQAKADDWGCTVYLCLASPTNPMQIKDCAAALLKIRPWKKPTCSAAKVRLVSVKEETAVCPD